MKQYKQKPNKNIKSKFEFWDEFSAVFNFAAQSTDYRLHHAFWSYIIWFPIITNNAMVSCGLFFVTQDNINNRIKKNEKI